MYHFRDVVLPQLLRFGKRIGQDADVGNETAQQMIAHCALLRRSFDPLTAQLVEEGLKQWLAQARDESSQPPT